VGIPPACVLHHYRTPGEAKVSVYTHVSSVSCVMLMLLSTTHCQFWQKEACMQLEYILTMDESWTRNWSTEFWASVLHPTAELNYMLHRELKATVVMFTHKRLVLTVLCHLVPSLRALQALNRNKWKLHWIGYKRKRCNVAALPYRRIHQSTAEVICSNVFGTFDFVHRLVFLKHKGTERFGNRVCFHSQVKGGRHLLCWVR
jgi:hypothetical protein